MGQICQIKPTQKGRELAEDMTPLWEGICREPLDEDQEKALKIINRLSPQVGDGFVWLEDLDSEQILTEWGGDYSILRLILGTLKDMAFIHLRQYAGRKFEVWPDYAGLAWETRRGFTVEARFLDERVIEWETTSVDHKRELYLDTADQKAEFVKDVIGLANTQASGQRWMIIGFDDKTRAYHAPPDTRITQDRIEQILARYTYPIVAVRYSVVDYRSGRVGKIEVLREARHLPYKVAESIGDKKRISKEQIFVRHGSQTEAPTEAELNAIMEEAGRAADTRS
jgi:hypothetical protein